MDIYLFNPLNLFSWKYVIDFIDLSITQNRPIRLELYNLKVVMNAWTDRETYSGTVWKRILLYPVEFIYLDALP